MLMILTLISIIRVMMPIILKKMKWWRCQGGCHVFVVVGGAVNPVLLTFCFCYCYFLNILGMLTLVC